MNRVVVFLLKEIYLERKDGEELIYIALDILDAILLPCPYLWCDVVEDFGG